MSENRVLLLSWEYPPVIEGGLARHVCKLAEALVRQGVAVDVLTRGAADQPALLLPRTLWGARPQRTQRLGLSIRPSRQWKSAPA